MPMTELYQVSVIDRMCHQIAGTTAQGIFAQKVIIPNIFRNFAFCPLWGGMVQYAIIQQYKKRHNKWKRRTLSKKFLPTSF